MTAIRSADEGTGGRPYDSFPVRGSAGRSLIRRRGARMPASARGSAVIAVVRRTGGTSMDDGRLERDLAAAVDGEVRFDAGTRAAYSTDASNFRQVPIGV